MESTPNVSGQARSSLSTHSSPPVENIDPIQKIARRLQQIPKSTPSKSEWRTTQEPIIGFPSDHVKDCAVSYQRVKIPVSRKVLEWQGCNLVSDVDLRELTHLPGNPSPQTVRQLFQLLHYPTDLSRYLVCQNPQQAAEELIEIAQLAYCFKMNSLVAGIDETLAGYYRNIEPSTIAQAILSPRDRPALTFSEAMHLLTALSRLPFTQTLPHALRVVNTTWPTLSFRDDVKAREPSKPQEVGEKHLSYFVALAKLAKAQNPQDSLAGIEGRLCDFVNSETAMSLLALAVTLDLACLRTTAIDLIHKNYHDIHFKFENRGLTMEVKEKILEPTLRIAKPLKDVLKGISITRETNSTEKPHWAWQAAATSLDLTSKGLWNASQMSVTAAKALYNREVKVPTLSDTLSILQSGLTGMAAYATTRATLPPSRLETAAKELKEFTSLESLALAIDLSDQDFESMLPACPRLTELTLTCDSGFTVAHDGWLELKDLTQLSKLKLIVHSGSSLRSCYLKPDTHHLTHVKVEAHDVPTDFLRNFRDGPRLDVRVCTNTAEEAEALIKVCSKAKALSLGVSNPQLLAFWSLDLMELLAAHCPNIEMIGTPIQWKSGKTADINALCKLSTGCRHLTELVLESDNEPAKSSLNHRLTTALGTLNSVQRLVLRNFWVDATACLHEWKATRRIELIRCEISSSALEETINNDQEKRFEIITSECRIKPETEYRLFKHNQAVHHSTVSNDQQEAVKGIGENLKSLVGGLELPNDQRAYLLVQLLVQGIKQATTLHAQQSETLQPLLSELRLLKKTDYFQMEIPLSLLKQVDQHVPLERACEAIHIAIKTSPFALLKSYLTSPTTRRCSFISLIEALATEGNQLIIPYMPYLQKYAEDYIPEAIRRSESRRQEIDRLLDEFVEKLEPLALVTLLQQLNEEASKAKMTVPNEVKRARQELLHNQAVALASSWRTFKKETDDLLQEQALEVLVAGLIRRLPEILTKLATF